MTFPFVIERTTMLVTAYVSRNAVPASDLPGLIRRVHAAIATLEASPNGAIETAVVRSGAEIAASIRHDGLVSFVDGKPYKTLKRHLTAHGLTPPQYRARYGLPADYPMVAPAYAATRARIARRIRSGDREA